ncbi:uncharacterized protein C3orf20-like isoform X2 [Erinaceus europaeus]|nr:uncharacterized protein C3orf20-like isoform X2 [Erinaceus europaeus]
MYTNIFSNYHKQVIIGTFTPFGCGSISFPKSQVISMMFNQDGGIVISRTGNILREWMWPLKGKLKDPVEVTVNKYITVEVSGRFAITLTYIAYAKVVKLSLAPVKCKSCCPCLPESLFRDASAISREAKELYKIYKIKCKQMKPIAREKHRPSLSDPVDVASFDPVMDISIMYDIKTVITIRKLQRKVKHILLHWLDHYRLAVGLQSLHVCGIPRFLQDVAKKEVPSAEFPLPQSATEKDESREYLRYRYTFLKLKGIYRLSPLHYIQKTTVSKKFPRNPLPVLGMDAVQLACPVVLRRALRGKEGDECRCSASSIPEVTDLEYDYLIGNQLTSLDQIIIVYVFAAKEKDNCMREVVKLYRELNRSRRMPCFESRLDSFRLLKYSIISASKFTGGKSPLLVERHNVVPGIFLMYIQGKLLFANFIFNGYSTSAKDLQKQVEKTRNDFLMGYFLPSDFRIQ